jgi:hypothetical protein
MTAPKRLTDDEAQMAADGSFEGLDEEGALNALQAAARELLAARKVIAAAEAYRAVPPLKNPEMAAELLSALDLALLEYRLAVGDE